MRLRLNNYHSYLHDQKQISQISNWFNFGWTSTPFDFKNTNINNRQHIFLIRQTKKKVYKRKFYLHQSFLSHTVPHLIGHTFSRLLSHLIFHFLGDSLLHLIGHFLPNLPCHPRLNLPGHLLMHFLGHPLLHLLGYTLPNLLDHPFPHLFRHPLLPSGSPSPSPPMLYSPASNFYHFIMFPLFSHAFSLRVSDLLVL